MHNKYPKEKAMEWLIPLEEEGLHDGVINTIFNKDYLKHNQKLFQNKNVVDLGCHDGQSSSLLFDKVCQDQKQNQAYMFFYQ